MVNPPLLKAVRVRRSNHAKRKQSSQNSGGGRRGTHPASFQRGAGGYVVETAQDGYEALQKVILEDFELILMDILMPRMNGLDAIKALRMTHPVIPIVIVTGTTDDKMIEKCLAYGAMLALQKPVRAEALLETVGDIRMRLGKVGGRGTL